MNNSEDVAIPLAILGMSCRLPGAGNCDEFWQLVETGGDATGELPEEFIDRDLYYDSRKGVRGKTYSTVGGLTPRLPFDNAKCRLPEGEVSQYDPAHLTMCEVASDALRDAGFDPFQLPTRNVGVYYGHTGGSGKGGDMVYAAVVEQAARFLHDVEGLSALTREQRQQVIDEIVSDIRRRYDHRVGNASLDVAAHVGSLLIARCFGLDGPCAVIDAACASSLQALMVGGRALQQGKIDMAIVGGASCCKGDSLILFSAAQSVSADKSCPFAEDANGLVTAEGYVTLVLKRLDAALRDGNAIRGVIRSIGVSADGRGKSLWAPRKEGQILAMERAYQGDVRLDDIEYIEAHATSTQVGDATELAALAAMFQDKLPAGRRIPLGSVKANIGHTLETAGMAGLAKVVLALERGVIPPVANLATPNPSIPWDDLPFYLPRQAEPWRPRRPGKPRIAAVNAFGIGGLNVHVVVEEFTGTPAQRALAAPAQRPRVPASLSGREPIAVIGMGAILPGAQSIEALWELLLSGRDVKTDVPRERWDAEISYDPTSNRPYSTHSKRGGFITNYEYDWRRHRIPPKQIANANPLQFMLLDAAEQAFQQAGYLEKQFDRERVGVVVGTIFGGDFSNQLQVGLRLPEFDRLLANALRNYGLNDRSIQQIVERYDEIVLTKMPALLDETGSFTSSTLASRITKTFDLKGGALAIDAGVNSALAGLDACVDMLRAGTCDMMICAAGQRNMDIAQFDGLRHAGVLARDPNAPAYDEASRGLVPGEGCGVVLLKRLSDAQRDGDKVIAVIRDIGVGMDCRVEGEAIKQALGRALAAAPQSGQRLQAVEALGTIPEAERCEFTAISHALEEAGNVSPVWIHSSIPQFGLLGAAQSMVSVIRACLATQRGKLPGGMGPRQPRAELRGFSRLRPLQRTQDIATKEGCSIAVCCGNELGAAYASIIEPPACATAGEQAPASANAVGASPAAPAALRTVRVGAGDWTSLQRSLAALTSSDAWAQEVRFQSEDYARVAIVCHSPADLEQKLAIAREKLTAPLPALRETLARQQIYFGTVQAKPSHCGFVFPGQGSQYAGMLDSWLRDIPAARDVLRQIDSAMNALGYESFQQIAGRQATDLGVDIWKTQVSLLLADALVDRTLRWSGLRPAIVLGHSFGEYPALVSAGVWSLTDAIRFTRHRFDALQRMPNMDGKMAATDAPLDHVERVVKTIGGDLYVANINAPDQTVISGRTRMVEAAVERLKADRYTAVLIKVPLPFHTPLMEQSAKLLSDRLPDFELRRSEIPVVSTANGEMMRTAKDLARSLISQLVSPVNYPQMLDRMLREQPALIVEVGPQRVLTQLNKKHVNAGATVFHAVDNPRLSGASQLAAVLAQADCLGCWNDTSGDDDAPQLVTHQPGKRLREREPILEWDATKRRRDKLRRRAAERAEAEFSSAPRPLRQDKSNSAPAKQRPGQGNGDRQSVYREPAQPQLETATVLAALTLETTKRSVRTEVAPAIPATISPTVLETKANPLPSMAAPSTDELHHLLVEFVVEQTGYPEDMIELDADLEADLGIDSIKKAQLFAEVGERFDIAPREDLSLDDFPTLNHVVAFLAQELGSTHDEVQVSAPMPVLEPDRMATREVDLAAKPEPVVPMPSATACADTVPSAAKLQQELVEFIVEQTGYPEEIVELDADLEADLGIDSIKKAQLFAEVGERYSVAPREDLSLDDFPTLGHVIRFLLQELELPTKAAESPSGAAPPTASPGQTTAARPLLDQIPSEICLLELVGTAAEMGSAHGEQLADDIYRAVGTMTDAHELGTAADPDWWPERWRRELDAIAQGAQLNREAIYNWNAHWRFPGDAQHDDTTVAQIRRQPGTSAYVALTMPGQILVRRGVNAAGLALSCDADGDPPEADVVAVTLAVHEILASRLTATAAHSKLASLRLIAPWSFTISAGTHDELYTAGAAETTECQISFHRAMREHPALLVVTNHPTGETRSLDLTSLATASGSTPRPVSSDVMGRYVLRMTQADRAAPSGTPCYCAGDSVALIGSSPSGDSILESLRMAGCDVEQYAGTDGLARFTARLENRPPDHVLLLEGDAITNELDTFRPTHRLLDVFTACQRWIGAREQRGPVTGSLVALTRMGGDFGFASPCYGFAGGALTGLLKGIRREFPAMRVHVLDFPAAASAEQVVTELLQEMAAASTELEIGFRDGFRYLVQAVAKPADAELPASQIVHGGVWVVTGGGRGVTSYVARELGKRYGLKLHLVGTAPLPADNARWRGLDAARLKELKKNEAIEARRQGRNPGDDWRKVERAMELEANLRQFLESGVDATYHVCDVADRSALARLLEEIRQVDGPIDGILHGAGVEAACRFTRKKPDMVRATIASKADGAVNLMALTRKDPLRYFVAFGSTSGRFGGLGQADYSLAQDLLAKLTDRLAHERPECKSVCFHWPAWDEVGMASRPESRLVLEKGGMAFMPPLEGVTHVIRELERASSDREILILDKPDFLDTDATMVRVSTPASPDLFAHDHPGPGQPSSPVFAAVARQPLSPVPWSRDASQFALIDGVEAGPEPGSYLAQLTFDPQHDPFLFEHQFRRQPFLPGVMSMECFVEAARLVWPDRTFSGLADVELVNGWSMPGSEPRRATVRLREVGNALQCELLGGVKDVKGQVVDAKRVFAKALVEFDDAAELQPIDPGAPVFTWTPFVYPGDAVIRHGKPFQTFRMLDFQHGGGRAQIHATSPASLLGHRSGDLVLACACLDGCLVACGFFGYCMLERTIELPLGFRQLRHGRAARDGERCIARFFYRDSNQHGNVYDFMLLGEAGDVVLEARGYRTKRVAELS